jgi:3' terminal RNA ribose 2'-O-methyltransferase Hen1
MLLTISTTYSPATDLGYLLHKNPARLQTFDLPFGHVHVFYPAADERQCTAALLLDINAVELVRRENSLGLEQYVNDRPYAASSFLSVAIAQVYGSALNGKCKDRPELVQSAIPLEAQVAGLPAHGGEKLLVELFEPLGYEVTVERYPLDTAFPDWGDSRYYTLTLRHTLRLSDLLGHLYVLIPVLDNNKHYFVADDEVEKLLRRGEGWLANHPAKRLIAQRYLKNQRSLMQSALSRLVAEEIADVDESADTKDAAETIVEEKIDLHTQRLGAVLAALKASGARCVVDLGCGEGKLLSRLLREPQFERIVGMDVSYRSLRIAAERLRLDELPMQKREQIQLIHGSLMYLDPRLQGFDAAALVEVIEHLDQPRLAAFQRAVFAFAQPKMVVITTPNVEYNVKWETLPAGRFRHQDHRFEWTRAEFQQWAEAVGAQYGYGVRFLPIGIEDPSVGAPSQMAVFTQIGAVA